MPFRIYIASRSFGRQRPRQASRDLPAGVLRNKQRVRTAVYRRPAAQLGEAVEIRRVQRQLGALRMRIRQKHHLLAQRLLPVGRADLRSQCIRRGRRARGAGRLHGRRGACGVRGRLAAASAAVAASAAFLNAASRPSARLPPPVDVNAPAATAADAAAVGSATVAPFAVVPNAPRAAAEPLPPPDDPASSVLLVVSFSEAFALGQTVRRRGGCRAARESLRGSHSRPFASAASAACNESCSDFGSVGAFLPGVPAGAVSVAAPVAVGSAHPSMRQC